MEHILDFETFVNQLDEGLIKHILSIRLCLIFKELFNLQMKTLILIMNIRVIVLMLENI